MYLLLQTAGDSREIVVLRVDVPEHERVALSAEHIVDADIVRLEPAIRLASWTVNAAPVAEFATKSTASVTGFGCKAAFVKQAAVACLV